MKSSLPISLFILSILLLNIITFPEVLSIEEKSSKKKKIKKHSQGDEEFDDPSLLSNKADNSNTKNKKKKEKENESEEKPKKDEEDDEEKPKKTKKEEAIYPTEEQLKKDEIEEMSKYKYFLLKYFYEVCMGGLLLFYIFNAIIGTKKNRAIAEKWLEKNLEFYTENYAHLGGEREYNPKSIQLMKDSYHCYKFFASGRVYVGWQLIEISLKRRQDLISILSQLFLFNEKDKIAYETSFLPVDELPVVFCICKRKEIKSTKKNYSEVNEFTEGTNPNFLDSNYILLTEDEEITNKIFHYNQQFIQQFKKIEKYLDFLLFTDRRGSKDKHGLIVTFDLKGKYDDSIFYEMSLFVHMLIDILGATNIKASYKKEALGRRKDFDAKQSRELAEKNAEDIKNAKDEKKSQEKSKPMTREQMQKKEEKERKEALKERRKKLYKVVKA